MALNSRKNDSRAAAADPGRMVPLPAAGDETAYLTAGRDGAVLIAVHVQPKASRNGVVGLHDGCLKITVTTPPVDGKANAAVATFLARLLGVGKGDVRLASGPTSRRKVFCVSGTTLENVRGVIEPILEK